MSRPFALLLLLAFARGMFAQVPAADDARIAEAAARIDAGRSDDAIGILAPAGGPDEARAVAKEYVRANPHQASGHLVAGTIFETQEFLVPALFSYMRFLALEPSSPRSAAVAARLQRLIATAGLQETHGKIAPRNSRREEGDFAKVEYYLWYVNHRVSTGFMLDTKGASDFDKAIWVLGELIQLDALDQRSKEAKKEPPNFTSTVQRPFFAAMDRRQLTYVYAALALAPLKLPGSEEAMKNEKVSKKVERYRAWIRSQTTTPKGK